MVFIIDILFFYRITEADGGFFASFGNLMQEHNEQLAVESLNDFNKISIRSRSQFYDIERGEEPPTIQDSEFSKSDDTENGTIEPTPAAPPKTDSDTETDVSTDDEIEREPADYISVGWNVSIF